MVWCQEPIYACNYQSKFATGLNYCKIGSIVSRFVCYISHAIGFLIPSGSAIRLFDYQTIEL